MSGDFSHAKLYTGNNQIASSRRDAIGRAIYIDGLTQHIAWLDQYLSLDPYAAEIRFGAKHRSWVAEAVEPPVLTHGTRFPQTEPGDYGRRNGARGSLVFNAQPSPDGLLAGSARKQGLRANGRRLESSFELCF